MSFSKFMFQKVYFNPHLLLIPQSLWNLPKSYLPSSSFLISEDNFDRIHSSKSHRIANKHIYSNSDIFSSMKHRKAIPSHLINQSQVILTVIDILDSLVKDFFHQDHRIIKIHVLNLGLMFWKRPFEKANNVQNKKKLQN